MDIATMIGQFVANWPVWAVIIVAIIAGIAWFLWVLATAAYDWPYGRKEWWQDRHKRLEGQRLATTSKQMKKPKKG